MAISDGPLSGGPMGATEGQPAPKGRMYPYLIQAGVKLKIGNVRVEINTGAITGTGPQLRGTQADGFNIDPTPLSLVTGNVYEANNVEVTTAFASNLTAFYDTFDIDWEISRDGSTWEDAGTSSNHVYVCLADPIASSVTMFRTVVHLACSNPGATTKDEAVAHTWALLSGRTFQTWDNFKLYYYRKETSFEQNHETPASLLQNRTGQCGSWATMFQDALTINGINKNSDNAGSSYYTTAKCTTNPDTAFFWVKSWDELPASNDWFYFESLVFDMRPPPADGNYGHYDNGVGTQFENDTTLQGQNSGTDAPSQKVFNNHQFIKYTNLSLGVLYYDPSYGATYVDAADFQTHLNGYGDVGENFPSINPQKLRLGFKPLPGSTIVSFDH